MKIDSKELDDLVAYFRNTYRICVVDPNNVKPIDLEKAQLLFSLRLPVCFFDPFSHCFVVANSWNPFRKITEQWYAWVDAESTEGATKASPDAPSTECV